ncbi:uncharacterized protein BT62DRAFT_934891 [Guyanagaster necrorhizus]|uniref:Uncharacterized protein n=1 Tax=Guyanagaster necrorhizus TaxID=856835 RepID=A0A9P7VN27_9AGAR|nr:uncharacterized protein BT62DRAFT_934891 [Guyanagaster necrorhizus MCA 3950]KAG7443657.1 hypothetical protein BT62DRAFT_934891 [Guyanagaster necrorhizus MCA 3950]
MILVVGRWSSSSRGDSLRQGLSVCVDRTNFNEAQRKYWIQIALEFPGTLIWVIVFDTPYEVCVSRLRERKFHPTIKTPEQALDVLARFASDFVPPNEPRRLPPLPVFFSVRPSVTHLL